MQRQEADDAPLLLVLAPTFNVQQLRGTTCSTIFYVHYDYKRYPTVVIDDEGLFSEVLTEVLHDNDDVFAQRTLCETGSGSSFSTNNRLVIVRALQRFSKTAPTLGNEFSAQI